MFDGRTIETIGLWHEVQSWGDTWIMELERITSKSGKTKTYQIYHWGGQSYPVGSFRSLKAALKMMASFSNYTKVMA
jgi:hypothetical protein